MKYYQDGLAISRQLADANPGDARAQRDLSVSYERLGGVTLQLGHTAPALKYYEDALAVGRQLAEANPGDAQAQRDLTVSYEKLGDVTLQLGETAAALKYYQDGFAIRRQLAEANPGDAQAQRDLSVSYDKLGNVMLQLGQTAAALKSYEDGLAIRRELTEANPGDAQAQRDFMLSHYNLARAEKQGFDYAASQEHFQKASEVLARMAESGLLKEQVEREMQVIKQETTACAEAAVAYAGLERIDEFDEDVRPTLLCYRIIECARHGDAADAARAAEKLLQLAGDKNAERLYLAACGYSLCVRVFDTPPRGGVFLPPEQSRTLSLDEQATRDNYVKLALETLKQAVAAGYNDADQMRQDNDLTPLRNLPEFQKLLEKLKAK